MWSPDRLEDLLAASDVLVLACPLTDETRHLIGTEPLPPDHAYWQLPNAIVTPHAAFIAPDNAERAAEEFAANLGRYLRGEPLANAYGGAERGY